MQYIRFSLVEGLGQNTRIFSRNNKGINHSAVFFPILVLALISSRNGEFSRFILAPF